jgi:Glycosyl hydrolase catalytic core
MTRQLVLVLALATVVCAPFGASASAGPVVGIGDPPAMAPSDLTDPLFMPLGIKTQRIVLPWNAVETEPVLLEQWAGAVRDIGIDPLVVFGASRGDRCPNSPCRLPTDAEYTADFQILRHDYPWLRTFTPWNEPNHVSQPTVGAPAAAAHYADLLAQSCPDCRIVAGDMLDAPGMLGYLGEYRAALHTTPAAWGLHNYYDTADFDDARTSAFIDAVPGPVWITETGGIVTWRNAYDQVQMPYDEQRAAQSLEFGLGLAAAHAGRVERVYVYQWRAGPADNFDAGLLRPDGSPRPALDVLRRALTPVVAQSPATTGEGSVGATLRPGFERRARGRATLSAFRLDRRGRLSLAVRCTTVRCRGMITIAGAGAITERLVNGRPRAGTLAPRRIHVAVRAGTTRRISVRLPRRVLRHAAHIGRIELTASLVPDAPGDFLASRRRVTLAVGPGPESRAIRPHAGP